MVVMSDEEGKDGLREMKMEGEERKRWRGRKEVEDLKGKLKETNYTPTHACADNFNSPELASTDLSPFHPVQASFWMG